MLPFGMRPVVPVAPPNTDEEYLGALSACGGFYQTPMSPEGVPLGPLVGYSGRYKDEASGGELQYVGHRYFNMAIVEQFPDLAEWFARGLAVVLADFADDADCIVGVPEGGLILGHNTADQLYLLYAGLQKRVVELATSTSKEKVELVLGRHEISEEMRVFLCEDLCNNFSTVGKAAELVTAAGAKVEGIICAINRSGKDEYEGTAVIPLINLPTPQYRQDDPAVAPYIDDPEVGVVWDVKPNWPWLAAVMGKHSAGIE